MSGLRICLRQLSPRNVSPPRSKVGRITGDTGKSAEDERVAAGSGVARKRSNVRGAKGPCHLQCLQRKEGKDAMTKASIDLQDLRRRLYVKAMLKASGKKGVPQ